MYVGEVTHQGRVYPGEQPAIIDRDLFDAVQAKLASQWTPLKQACLRRCRSPLEFLTTEWREGPRGVFVMGLRHGGYCLGCCWMLMLLLFVGGIMNMVWIAGIALFVLIEKLAPAGHWIGKAAGGLLVLWGLATLVW
jgi:predicted metal-binding membrane protein